MDSKLVRLGLATALLSSVALVSQATVSGAADVPARAYRAPAPPYYLWSGFYVGAHIGGGTLDGGGFFGGDTSGFLGGGQVGFNYQIHNWVLGVEGDVSATTIGGNFFGLASWNLDTVSTLAFRGGYAFDRWLVYGKFGEGWGHFSVSVPGFSIGDTGSGALFGVGAEYALGNNWSAKVEYNHIAGDFQSFKAGVNYRFGQWPY